MHGRRRVSDRHGCGRGAGRDGRKGRVRCRGRGRCVGYDCAWRPAWGGNPAKFLRALNDKETAFFDKSATSMPLLRPSTQRSTRRPACRLSVCLRLPPCHANCGAVLLLLPGDLAGVCARAAQRVTRVLGARRRGAGGPGGSPTGNQPLRMHASALSVPRMRASYNVLRSHMLRSS